MFPDYQRLTISTWIDAVEHHAEIDSTQDRARAAAADFALGRSLLVVADRQNAGRGRGANQWWTGDGNLAFSLLFDPATFGLPRRAMPQVSLAAATAVVDTVAPLLGGHVVGLHWPNDVYTADRKLAGILVDVLADGRHILGVGINTNCSIADAPAELHVTIATLRWLTGRVFDHGALLESFITRFGDVLGKLAKTPDELGARFNDLCLQHGDALSVHNGGQVISGRCAGIATDGALLLDTERGRQAIYSGTLH
jgi:BirA family transcriptional regulator, biotin operon repressor / biotin---[acetyl-CoA-carboxylase] ligase